MNILIGIRRLDHIQYFNSIISELVKEPGDLFFAIDPNFLLNDSTHDTKLHIENKFGWVIQEVFQLSAGNESIREIKRMLGCLVYLNDDKLEWKYLVRHAKRSHISPLNFLLLNALRVLPRKLRVNLSSRLTNKYRKLMQDTNLINSWMLGLDLDVIYLSPGNMFNSYEDELILDGKKLKIQTVVQTLSWDNLNSKGTVMAIPDLYLCWNEMHSKLLMRRHLIPRERIRISGPVFFEKYSGIFNNFTKIQFCEALGISQKKEIIVYMGSSLNVCLNETSGLFRMLSDFPEFNEKYFLVIRPHPANVDVWLNWQYPGTYVWPKFQSLDVRSHIETRSILNSSLGVVGINTSGFLDALVCGVTVVALENPDAIYQENTTHYSQLIQDGLMSVKTLRLAVALLHDPIYPRNIMKALELTLPSRDTATSNSVRFIKELTTRGWGGKSG